MIVVAHPDDETIAMGAQLCRFETALLVHVTDGAPRDGRDAQACGFASVTDYAAARRRELQAALAAGEAAGVRSHELGVADQDAARQLPQLARRLAHLVKQECPAAIFTHAYEGGHPDHDATALAVHAACCLADEHPEIIEFPLYHRNGGNFTTGQFLPRASRLSPGASGQKVLGLAVEERTRKQRMIDCFATQQQVLQQFEIATERFRIAPVYDFSEAPHPGPLNYECWGMPLTGAAWRSLASAALRQLGLVERCP